MAGVELVVRWRESRRGAQVRRVHPVPKEKSVNSSFRFEGPKPSSIEAGLEVE